MSFKQDALAGCRQLGKRIQHAFDDQSARQSTHDLLLGDAVKVGVVPVQPGIVAGGDGDLVVHLRARFGTNQNVVGNRRIGIEGGDTFRTGLFPVVGLEILF